METITKETLTLKAKPSGSATGRRMEWVDYARGIAIILVVFRHSIVGLNRSNLHVPINLYNTQEFVYNFRMAVFFILSGVFLSRSLNKQPTGTVLRKKASQLLYPYLLWTVIFITIQILLSKYTNSDRTYKDYLYIVTQPRNLDQMWYLLALFNTSVLYILLYPKLKDKPMANLGLALGLHLFSYLIRDYSLFSDICYYYIFLIIGTIVSKHIQKVNEWPVKKLLINLLILAPFFIFGQLEYLKLRPGNFAMMLPFLLIILVACSFFIIFCRLIYNIKLTRFLLLIGKNSLYIYIMHLLIISSYRIFVLKFTGITNPYFMVFSSLVLGVSMPILIYSIGKKWGMNYMFSLERAKNNNE